MDVFILSLPSIMTSDESHVRYATFHMVLTMPSPAGVKTPPPLTSAQIRAARALIRWTAEDLAQNSTVSVTTIRRAELTQSATVLTRVNDRVIRRTLEEAGVEFIDENGGGPGVRLRKKPEGAA
jgi:hypothetical protein